MNRRGMIFASIALALGAAAVVLLVLHQAQAARIVLTALIGYMIAWGALFRRERARGMSGFARFNRARPAASETTFNDVAANDIAMDRLRELADYLARPEKYAALGARLPRGVLLYGPPGTGKTLMARALAGEAHVPFFSLSGSDFV